MVMVYIRTASERDLDAIRALLVETWHHTYDAIYGPARVTEITEDWHSIPALRARLTRPNTEFVVADDGREIQGIAFAAAIDGGNKVMLHQLYVRPSRQRNGVGAMLLEAIEESFPDAKAIRLEVEPQNQAAVAFYRVHGFEEVDGTENCGQAGSGLPAAVFEKRLAA